MTPARPGWWRDAVFYQVYIRSFADANGDGIGDLPGIRSRLSYLADLGVDGIWITPFYPSPMADGGYDVADYRDIEPRFGTLADADALVDDAHRLGIRVVIDLVPNHTSNEHRWFREALAAAPGSPQRARYLFRDGRGPDGASPPNNWLSVFGGVAWTRVPDGQWYLHLFAPEQPDLDWTNPQVHEEFTSVLRFWLDRGVDGFRIDVAHGLAKDPQLPDLPTEALNPEGTAAERWFAERGRHHPFWDRPEVHAIYREWRQELASYQDRAESPVARGAAEPMMVAEAWVPFPDQLSRYVRPDELAQAFNFDFLECPWDAGELRGSIDRSISATSSVGASTTWVLSNHDVQRHVTRYGGGRVGRRRAQAAALLMLALPGSAYLYQGEELGLEEVVDLPEEVLADPVWERSGHTDRGRDGCRVPVPWTTTGPSLGFGTGPGWLPQPPAWAAQSVAAQAGQEGSTLELYRAALRHRHAEPSLGGGTMRWHDSPSGGLVFSRGADLVIAVNLGDQPLALPAHRGIVLASGPLDPHGRLPVDTAVWLRTAG
ncbi:MAG: glycoside hydrolase family 13 protein [Actinomycetes bacterium]